MRTDIYIWSSLISHVLNCKLTYDILVSLQTNWKGFSMNTIFGNSNKDRRMLPRSAYFEENRTPYYQENDYIIYKAIKQEMLTIVCSGLVWRWPLSPRFDRHTISKIPAHSESVLTLGSETISDLGVRQYKYWRVASLSRTFRLPKIEQESFWLVFKSETTTKK